MATRTDCLPWWHTKFVALSTGHSRPRISSGCSIVGGNVNCQPESMRARAEAELRRLGYWTKGTMPLAVYTLARYASSEVGGGTPEEKVAVMEAAINRARGTDTSRGYYPNDAADTGIVRLLLYRQGSSSHPNYGWYGPIHAGSTSPYGRWASTNQDPGIDDLLIADFVLAGKSNNFARNAVTQFGMDVRSIISSPRALVAKVAQQSGYYWVGPLPGVDHWHTFLLRQDKNLAPSSPQGQQLVSMAQASLTDPMQRADWTNYPVCRKPILKPILFTAAGLVVAGALW